MALQYRAVEAAQLLGDDSLGPLVASKDDFTIDFEGAIFTILPAALIILLTPYFLRNAFRKAEYMQSGILLWFKMICAVSLFGCEGANIVLWNVLPIFRSNISLAASIFACAGSVCVVVVLYAEHMYSYRPSTFLSIYMSITLLFDIAKIRSYFIRDGMEPIAGLAIAALILKFAIVVLEEVSKRHLVNNQRLQTPLSKESVSGFWNRSLFIWLNSTMRIGFKNILKIESLPLLGPEFDSEVLHSRFRKHWTPADQPSKYSLVFALYKTLFWEYTSAIVPRLCLSGFCLTQPILFRRIISAVENGDISIPAALGLLGATALLYIGIGMSKAYYTHLSNRTATFARGILGAAIYDKTLKLSGEQLQKFEAATLTTTDMESIQEMIKLFHDMWASALELGVSVYILASIIGPAAFLVLIPTLSSTIGSSVVVKFMTAARRLWNEKIELRVAATSNVLAQLKSVKITGLAPLVTERLEKLRNEEILASLKERHMRIILHAIDMGANGIAPVGVIAGALFWTRNSEPLTIADIFTTLALVTIVTAPLTQLLLYLPQCFAGIACIHRVQDFLNLDEVTDTSNNRFETFDGSIDQLRKSYDLELVTSGNKPYAVELTNATLFSLDRTIRIFDNITLKIRNGRVTMIIGPVGCGKTVLLKVVLGEIKLDHGFVITCQGKIAYCGETPWLRDMSIRDNIIAQSNFNTPWYNSVVHACALDEDIRQLADGDRTIVGSGGCKLSGGQIQRVALARAVYSHPSMIVIDGGLSSTDLATSKAIMSRLFGQNGVVRRIGATVIMTTNILEHLPTADNVYTFEAGGKMRAATNNFNALAQDSALLKWLKHAPSSLHEKTESTNSPRVEAPEDPSPAEQAFERQRGDFSLYSYYLRAAGWRLMGLWIFSLAIAALSERMPQIYIRVWMEKAPDEKSYFTGFAVLGVGAAITLSLSLAFYYLKIVPKSSINLHSSLVQSLMKATLGFISTTESGSLLNRFSQDMSNVSQRLPISLMEFSYLVMGVAIDIGIVFSGATYAAALVPVVISALYAIQYYYLRTSRQVRHLDLEWKAPLYTMFTETTSGIEHVRAFYWQAQYMWQMLGLLDYSQRPAYAMYCIQVWLVLVLDMCVTGIAVSLVAFAVFFPEATSPTAIGLALVNLVTFSDSSSLLVKSWATMETSLGSIHRTRDFNETVRLEESPTHSEADRVPQDFPGEGRIEIVGVTAKYNETDDDAQAALKDFSITIPAGQKLGVLGRTGSGKSSLVLTLLNFLHHSGSISIDGRDIRTIPHEFLRSRITTIAQDGVELAGSLRLNVDPYDDPDSTHRLSDETLIDLLKDVGLWDRLKAVGNLDTEISRFKLSGGEKQLLGIARAILRKQYNSSRIVLMDEATSKMDAETDRRVQKVMEKAFEHSTVITVAHRLHAVENSDVIIEIQSGKIVKSLDRSHRRRQRANRVGTGDETIEHAENQTQQRAAENAEDQAEEQTGEKVEDQPEAHTGEEVEDQTAKEPSGNAEGSTEEQKR